MWDELTILWNDLTILWNDLTMERNDRIPFLKHLLQMSHERKSNKFNKIHDFGREEAKRHPEMSANTAKVTQTFHARQDA